jgi:hypothetical protein
MEAWSTISGENMDADVRSWKQENPLYLDQTGFD